MIFALLAGGIALSLLIGLRWMVVSGFTALWGAFTFPLAAFCGALYAIGADVTATIFLAMALGLIPYVGVKVMQAWAQGGLAAKTNAAEA
jgi:tellurite resistance protein